MSTEFFCCSDLRPHIAHGARERHNFDDFVKWAKITLPGPYETKFFDAQFIIQLIRQSAFRSNQSFRYFLPIRHGKYEEIPGEIAERSFELSEFLGSLECVRHNQFFYISRFERSHVSTHSHSRSSTAGAARSGALSAFTQLSHVFGHLHSGSGSSTATRSGSSSSGLPSFGSSSFRSSSFGSSSFGMLSPGPSETIIQYDDADSYSNAVSSDAGNDTDPRDPDPVDPQDADSDCLNDLDDQMASGQGESLTQVSYPDRDGSDDVVYCGDETEDNGFDQDNLDTEDSVFGSSEGYDVDSAGYDCGDLSSNDYGDDDW